MILANSHKFSIFWVITISLVLVFPSASAAPKSLNFPVPEIAGFYKNLFSVTDVGDNFKNLNVTNSKVAIDDFQRLRLKFDVKLEDTIDIRIHYEVRSVWGDTARIQNKLNDQTTSRNSELHPFINPPSRQRFMDLESELERESNFLLEHDLDRLQFRLQTETLELTMGRQAVSWGTGLIWNPTDLFSGFAPTEIDRDEKFGVDVARVTVNIDQSSVDFIAEPLGKDDSYSIDPQSSSVAVRGATHIGEYDVSFLSGFIAGDWVVGGDFSGYLKDAGFRGEWIYTSADGDDERDYFRALVSTDYAFQTHWDPYIAMEYFYNGVGTSNEDGYLARLSKPSVQRVFQRGNAFNVGRNYIGLLARLTPSTLITLQSTMLWNIEDSSVREFLTVTWSLDDDIDFLFGGDVGLGKLGTEFGGFSKNQAGIEFRNTNLYFAFLKIYF